MLHRAAVNIPFVWCEGQGADLVEGLVVVGIILTQSDPFFHWNTIFSPGDFDVRWVEMIHEADKSVFHT